MVCCYCLEHQLYNDFNPDNDQPRLKVWHPVPIVYISFSFVGRGLWVYLIFETMYIYNLIWLVFMTLKVNEFIIRSKYTSQMDHHSINFYEWRVTVNINCGKNEWNILRSYTEGPRVGQTCLTTPPTLDSFSYLKYPKCTC